MCSNALLQVEMQIQVKNAFIKDYPPWLGKLLKLDVLDWLKMHFQHFISGSSQVTCVTVSPPTNFSHPLDQQKISPQLDFLKLAPPEIRGIPCNLLFCPYSPDTCKYTFLAKGKG